MDTAITIVIDDGFPLLSLSFVTEPLRLANRESARPIFRWRLVSPSGAAPRSSSGLAIEVDGALDDAPTDVVILLASYAPAAMLSRELTARLRRHAARGALMGCVDTGALLFAAAGLLDRRPAAAHHEALPGFREAYGAERFSDKLFDFGGDRCSSAGGAATFDMTLALIAHFTSRRLARRVAAILNYRPLSAERAEGAFGPDWSIPRFHRVLAQSVEMMLAHIERPLPIGEIARRVDWPEGRLRRLFHRHVGRSPQRHYLELRLDRARNLLRNSPEPVGAVALMCGFPATESLSRAYRARFGVAPSQDRGL